MPKYNIIIEPHTRLDNKLHEMLSGMFKEKEMDRLLKLGGRVQVSLTVPYSDKTVKTANIQVNAEFMEKLVKETSNAEEMLAKLPKKKLIEIVKYLKMPISSKANLKDVRSEILKYLKFPEVWKEISR